MIMPTWDTHGTHCKKKQRTFKRAFAIGPEGDPGDQPDRSNPLYLQLNRKKTRIISSLLLTSLHILLNLVSFSASLEKKVEAVRSVQHLFETEEESA